MMKRFLVVYEYASGSYTGYAPDLLGCRAAGDTHEEIQKKMREVVENHVRLLVAEGSEVPRPVNHIVNCPKPVQESDVKHWGIERLEIEVPVASRAEHTQANT